MVILLLVLAGAAAIELPHLTRLKDDCLPESTSNTTSWFPRGFHVAAGKESTDGSSTVHKFGDRFLIEYFNTYKVVTNLVEDEKYVLAQCTYSPFFAAPVAHYPGTKGFSIPLTSVASGYRTAAFLVELGLTDRVAYASNASVNPCLQQLGGCGRYKDENITTRPTFMAHKLDTRNTIAFSPFTGGQTPLESAEWVKFMAVFFNKEPEANAVYAEVSSAYNHLAAEVKKARGKGADWPVVAWMTVDEEYITIFQDAHFEALTKDAGGRLVNISFAKDIPEVEGMMFADHGDGTLTLHMNIDEEAAEAFTRRVLKDVDVVFDISHNHDFYLDQSKVYTKDQLLANLSPFDGDYQNLFKFMINNQIYRIDNRVGPRETDFFEQGYARPDLVLKDLIQILTPAAAPKEARLYFIRNIDDSRLPMRTPRLCPVDQCTLKPKPICPFVYMDDKGKVVEVSHGKRCAPTCKPEETASVTSQMTIDAISLESDSSSGSNSKVLFIVLVLVAAVWAVLKHKPYSRWVRRMVDRSNPPGSVFLPTTRPSGSIEPLLTRIRTESSNDSYWTPSTSRNQSQAGSHGLGPEGYEVNIPESILSEEKKPAQVYRRNTAQVQAWCEASVEKPEDHKL